MINLQKLRDNELLAKLKTLVSQERELTTLILRHLEEVERRRLYCPQYSSLFEYATLELGYAPASAQRRISAMRTVKIIPEVEEKISSGALTLTHVAQAAKFFQAEAKNDKPLSNPEKLAILVQLEGKSTREAERELVSRSSNPQAFLQQESIRPVTETHSKVTFVAEQALLEDLEKVKALLSHKFPHLTTAELIAEMAKIALAKLESDKFAKREKSKTVEIEERSVSGSCAGSTATGDDSSKQNRYISADVKRAVYQRDGLQCTFIDESSGRRCISRHQLEFDHYQVPFASGGKNDKENLVIRCKAHNLWSATRIFGEKTRKYLK